MLSSELPLTNSAVYEKLGHRSKPSWTKLVLVPIPGVPNRRLRILVPNGSRWRQIHMPRVLVGRKRTPLLILLACMAVVMTVLLFSRNMGSENYVSNWSDPGEPPTLVFRRADLQRIWNWEIASGHYPSRKSIPRQVGLKDPPRNPALPSKPRKIIPSRYRPPPNVLTSSDTDTLGVGPKRVYLDIQSAAPDVAYPPRPVPGSVADMDVIMDHCNFSTGKYVRDCLEVLRLGGGLDNGQRTRRGNMDHWKYIYMELANETSSNQNNDDDIASLPIPIPVHRPTPNSLEGPDAGLQRKRGAEWEVPLNLPPTLEHIPSSALPSPCDPENPRIFQMFWTGPFTDKPYLALLSFLFTQNTGIHLREWPQDAKVCRPQFWLWINPGPAASVPNPNALTDMFQQLKESPWASPFLHPRFKDVIKFKLWNTTEQLDGIPEIKDEWRALQESLFNSGGHIISVKKEDEESTTLASEEESVNATDSGAGTATKKADEDDIVNRLGSKSSSSYDRLSVILSDMARFVLCHRFGGIYLDADTIFLRDWEELWGWKGAFAYRWSRLEKYNTAVLRMNKESALGTFLFRTALKNGLDFHPMTVSRYMADAHLEGLLLRLPDALFDSAWLNTEYYQRDRPPQPYFTEFGEFFDTPAMSSAGPQALGFNGFFRGAYSYHFHNFWWKPFDASRNFPDLGMRFIAGEKMARAALKGQNLPLSSALAQGTQAAGSASAADADADSPLTGLDAGAGGDGLALTRTTGALDSFISELGTDITYEKSLGSSRFLKTVKCRHRNGYLIVKVFIKPDPGLTLRNYTRRLKLDREALQDIANVYNYQSFVETDKAGYIIRQWVASNLYDTISTRPFLSVIEKKWIVFQLLTGLRDARNRKVSHGDIKSENILVTSWNWVYLSDFASYKPAYLPLDDPSDFSFFFDTSGRRTCYIAPERFYTAASNPEISAKKSRLALEEHGGKRDGKVTEAMDCFSVGCVIAELFLEGAPLFTLSQLFKYREGEYNVDTLLSVIEDEGVRNMIKRMIDLDPASRPTFESLLHTSRGTVFPESFFSFLHNYVSSINELSANSPFSTNVPPPPPTSAIPTPGIPPSASGTGVGTGLRPSSSAAAGLNSNSHVATGAGAGAGTGTSPAPSDLLPSDSDHRMERLWSDFDSVEPYLVEDTVEDTVKMDVKIDYNSSARSSKPFQDILPIELCIPNRDSKLSSVIQTGLRATTDGPALIILALVTANIRNCSLPSSKIRALDVFLALSPHLTDEAKLDRMVPYIVELLHDEAPGLMLVTVITPSNAAIFPEYIIPNIKYLVEDPEVSVRATYAQCIVQLAETAVRYLEMGQALKAHGSFKMSPESQEYDNYEVSYDTRIQDLQNSIQDHLSALLMDPSSIVKRAVLHDISYLCILLGRQKTNDVLLSHMITYLNDRDWLLRYAFFESIVDVAACAGGRSLEEYILPLMVQALSDVEESVVARVLTALTSLCELGLFQKMRIWELMSSTLGFLYHPNIWIRQGAAAFIASAAKHLPPSDNWCILYPSLRHLLKSDVVEIDEQSLLSAMKPPIPRRVFDAAVQWAMKADKASWWRGGRKGSSGSAVNSAGSSRQESPRESVVSIRKTGTAISRNMSEDDESNYKKLQQIGMTPSEETKLVLMKDYILKLANAIASFSSRSSLEPEAEKSLKIIGDVELPKLGVVPQTVFLKSSASELSLVTSRSFRRPLDLLRSPIVPGSPRRTFSDVGSHHGGAQAPFEELRRRLATINGSASSLGIAQGHLQTPPRSSAVSPIGVPATGSSSLAFAPSGPLSPVPMDSREKDKDKDRDTRLAPIDRPGSPTESVVSTANSMSFRPLSRMQPGSMSIDGQTLSQKAAPAVGSSKTNALGLLDSHLQAQSVSAARSDVSPERSGRASPVPLSSSVSQTVTMTPAVKPVRPRIGLNPISTYDGQEAGINHLLENLYLDNNRELQNDFGPKVHEGPVRRRNPVRHTFVSRDGSARKMDTTLIAHLHSHSDTVTGLAVSPDHMFFVSSSDDKTVKVWDTARLERNVTSKPRHTYGQHHARVKCVCILEGVHCFASAADDGSLHVVRVHVSQTGTLPKYSKLQVIREHRVETIGEYITGMQHYNTDASSNLVYTTTHSVITILDLRTMRILQTMENPRQYGPITCLCIDRRRSWILVGTSTGVLTLWDRRFGLLLKSWHVGVSSTGRSVRIHQCVVHPSKGRGKWVIVTVEASKRSTDRTSTIMAEVWDIEKSVLMETFVVRRGSTSETADEPHELTGVDADTSPAAAIAALIKSRQAGEDSSEKRSQLTGVGGTQTLLPPPAADARAVVVGMEFGGHTAFHRSDLMEMGPESPSRNNWRGFMLTGSDDRKIRLWDLGKVERSSILCGMENEVEKPSFSSLTSATASRFIETWPEPGSSQNNRPSQRISLITHNQQNLLKSHQDIITALACIDSPFRGGIVSGDRAGVIKVWRAEAID
ncbi:hypothetical protein D9758_014111 [Tetrapyrgos nigripes]|uniref:non-specific serine/threonine protein kinase n=1 Tax=Tetrapyrgos nigripes TaxID=182062 RepID=A0A8H5FJV1_9AGAR|nr:hypothetical protein D9758_014111 [Tetrapyrgos nigripes]